MSRKRPSSGLSKLLSIALVITVLITAMAMINMAAKLRAAYDRDRYSNATYYLREGDYGELVREYYRRGFDVAPYKSDYEQEYYAAQYADAAFMLRFYEAAGDERGIERCRERMALARDNLGSLAVAADDIDELIGNIRVYE